MKFGSRSLAVFGALLVCGMGAQAQQDYSGGVFATTSKSGGSSYPCNDTQFLQDQKAFENGQLSADQLENVCGIVTAVLPEKKTRSGHHGYFYVQVAPGQTIEIVSDLDRMNAPKWPWVAVGDTSTVRGRYYYDNDTSQGIDWTHHGTSSSWPHAGYVVVNGKLYQ
ncbi:MAG: DUF3465 domain-containing protein [Proteobacteria bacterium]|nr:DUF3465 domain-containing protein [Pseudomonadota bacterium]